MEPIEYTEVSPLPAVCVECEEEECYNCDHLLERWEISSADEERIKALLSKQREWHEVKSEDVCLIEDDARVCPICGRVFALDEKQKETERISAFTLIPICSGCQANIRKNGTRVEKDGEVFYTLPPDKPTE